MPADPLARSWEGDSGGLSEKKEVAADILTLKYNLTTKPSELTN
jgi:hypothetical protein